jgi:ribokinase
MMEAKALFLGVLNIDMVLEAGDEVIGNKIMGERVSTHAGGYGCTQSFGCARCGVPSAVIGKIGNDAFGRDILATLQLEGVDKSLVRIEDDQKTGLSTIIVRKGEPNMYLDFLGANFKMDAGYIQQHEQRIREFGFVSMHLGVATVEPVMKLLEIAQRFAIPSALNVSTVALPADVFRAKPDYLVLSYNTASLLCGFPVQNLKGARIATTLLFPKVKKAIIFQLDNLGVIVATKNSLDIVDAMPDIRIVDPSGMSDFFLGVFVAQMIKGKDLLECASKAHAAAMVCGQRVGVYASFPSREDLV